MENKNRNQQTNAEITGTNPARFNSEKQLITFKSVKNMIKLSLVNKKSAFFAVTMWAFMVLVSGCGEVGEYAKKMVTPKKHEIQPVRRTAVVDIIDGSGSGSSTYSVPHLSTENIAERIDGIRKAGEGDYWVTFIDMDARNNKVLHFSVAPLPEKPVFSEIGGEINKERDERFDKYKKAINTYSKDSLEVIREFQQSKKAFLDSCAVFLEYGYRKKTKGTDFSDIIGSLNAAFRSLATIENNGNTRKFIVLISDGVQETPHLKSQPVLENTPSDIKIIQVSHSGSGNQNILKGKSTEIDNLDRVNGLLF